MKIIFILRLFFLYKYIYNLIALRYYKEGDLIYSCDTYMLLCLGKVIEENASTCVAVGRRIFSISNSWLLIRRMMQSPNENGCCEAWMKTIMNI